MDTSRCQAKLAVLRGPCGPWHLCATVSGCDVVLRAAQPLSMLHPDLTLWSFPLSWAQSAVGPVDRLHWGK